MNEIFWPETYTPGFTDNFVSNEVIIAGLSAADIWPLLVNPEEWPLYYSNSANVRFHDDKGPDLRKDRLFYFETFGFPVESDCTECEAPTSQSPGRLAWHGESEAEGQRLDILHAWLIENLPGGRVRILTQESQLGEPARELAATRPNPMLNGHQQWLDGLIEEAFKRKA